MCANKENCKEICNKCGFLLKRKTNYGSTKSSNVYCDKNDILKLIELSINDDEDIKTPLWCPLKAEADVAEKIKNGTPLTEGEKKAILLRHTPIISWDEIEANQIYHIPAILGDKRKDILITWKGEYSCTFKDLSKNYSAVETFYPSTLMSRFLTKHKVKKVELVDKKV
jgi:hypothetical protein